MLRYIKELYHHKLFEHWRKQFNLFQDPSGVWRCAGRLHEAQVLYSTKFPALLLSQSHFTTLVIQRAHLRVLHNRTRVMLTELRSRYWIHRGRRLVREIIHRCKVCRHLEAPPYQAPPPPHHHPFEFKRHPFSHLQG